MTTGSNATPASTQTVLYRVTDSVAEIRLNRPESSNALDLQMAEALGDALARADQDEVGAVVLSGSGRLFCAGGDLAAMNAAPDRRNHVADLAQSAHEAITTLDALSKPVVAAVQGGAAGIGLSLVLGADLVVAGESAKFVTAYTSVGLTPDGGLSWRLPRVVGQRRASELILTSESVDAATAHALGIVSSICPDPDVHNTAQALAEKLTQRPLRALSAARQLVRSSWSHTLQDHLDVEAATIAEASASEEAGMLISDFLNRGDRDEGSDRREASA